MNNDRHTFRYIRVKFPETSKLYTYRCDFMVKPGDVLSVPTCYGQKIATVKQSSADEDGGFPTAKWATSFKNRPSSRVSPWLKNFRVRLKMQPEYVLYANQTKRCHPGQEPSSDHPKLSAPWIIKVEDIHPATEQAIKRYIESGRECIMPARRYGKSNAAKLTALGRGYGMGDSIMIKTLKRERKVLRKELVAMDVEIARAKDHKRLCKIENELEGRKAEVEYRARFKDLDGTDELVAEALEIKKRLKERM